MYNILCPVCLSHYVKKFTKKKKWNELRNPMDYEPNNSFLVLEFFWKKVIQSATQTRNKQNKKIRRHFRGDDDL